MPFFGTESDPQIAKDMLLEEPKIFISKQTYSGQGVVSSPSTDVVLTPAVSPAWTTNEHQSVAGVNIAVQTALGEVFEGPVKSNDATTVTFDPTAMISRLDGSAGALADFPDAGNLYFYLLTPHASNAWGDFFGMCKELELNAEEEYADFSFGIPEEDVRSDLVRIRFSMKGKNFDCMNEDVFQAIFNSAQMGSQTNQWEQQLGFNPGVRKLYRITGVGKTVEEKDMLVSLFLGQFKLEGAFSLTGKEHKGIGFTVMAKKESISTGKANVGRFRVAE